MSLHSDLMISIVVIFRILEGKTENAPHLILRLKRATIAILISCSNSPASRRKFTVLSVALSPFQQKLTFCASHTVHIRVFGSIKPPDPLC